MNICPVTLNRIFLFNRHTTQYVLYVVNLETSFGSLFTTAAMTSLTSYLKVGISIALFNDVFKVVT
jgi:hypothetical protein